MPEIEEYGVEPVPPELRTAGWRTLFAINFTFFLNPVMYVIGALAVVAGGLPLWWAVAALVAGQALAFAILVVAAQPGVDHGLPGQVAMRATFGFWGARGLTSPYRMVAGVYWFAAQALTGALGVQAIVQAITGERLPLVPVALALAVVQAAVAALGFDVMRWLLRVVLPLSLGSAAVLIGLYLASDDPAFAVGRVFESPDQQLTWVGFATFITVMCGATLTLVTNVADFCRYTPTRRDMRVGLIASALLSAVVTTFVGGYVGAATGETNPFVAAASLTTSDVVLALLLASHRGPAAVIVRDAGDAWQVVMQTDHADLAGAFADAWRDRGSRHESVAVAAQRHDDGWAVWERSPRRDESGKPVNFLDVDVRSHLAFYRAGIAAVTEHDPHAGLLVSMHGAGIYRQRYGLDPGLSLTRAPEVQERGRGVRRRAGGEVRRRPRRAPGRLRPAPALRPALALLLHARRRGRRGGRPAGAPARAGGAVARPDLAPTPSSRAPHASHSCGG